MFKNNQNNQNNQKEQNKDQISEEQLRYIETFHKTAEEFLNKLNTTLPQLKLSQYIFMYHAFKGPTYTTIEPIQLFMAGLEPYGLQVLSRDEHFFKDDQFVGSAESMSGQLGLVKIWDDIDMNTKDAIWRYIQLLYVLGMKSLGKNDEVEKIKSSIRK